MIRTTPRRTRRAHVKGPGVDGPTRDAGARPVRFASFTIAGRRISRARTGGRLHRQICLGGHATGSARTAPRAGRMKATEAFARLVSLGIPVVTPSEAASVLRISPVAAAQMLRRLNAVGLVQPLRHGQFWISREPMDPWVALEYISTPYPAYVSLYTALYLHGILSQIPAVHYAVTLGRTKKVKTLAGVFSLHRIAPELFDGFDTQASGAKVATAEKAIFDLAYLAGTRSRIFSRPPELELAGIKRRTIKSWVDLIPDTTRRERVNRQVLALVGP